MTTSTSTLQESEVRSPLVRDQLESSAKLYDDPTRKQGWASKAYHQMLAEYYNLQIPADATILEIGCGSGELLSQLKGRQRVGIDLSELQIENARKRIPDATFHVQAGEDLCLTGTFDCIIISETINFAADAQRIFEKIHSVSHPRTRLILNFFNNLWQPLSLLATAVGMRSQQVRTNWLSHSDVRNLLSISGWETVTQTHRILIPFSVFGLERILNRTLAPLVPHACITIFSTARPLPKPPIKDQTVSVIIPARNEAGNIEAAVRRTPAMGTHTELIFVEGNSTDDTWKEILRVADQYPEKHITCIQQTGIGKGDAVRAGFAAATGDILMILDADLTVPPEELPKFYQLIASGRAEFANGVRLVYPMQDEAMRFLNLCANKTFSIIFTWLMGQPIKDTLCGTKVLLRTDYERLAANRAYFGDFDPFGDFDLLFGAGKLGLRIADIPIRYGDRTYGTTNISRWKHGLLLIRMVLFAAKKLKFT